MILDEIAVFGTEFAGITASSKFCVDLWHVEHLEVDTCALRVGVNHVHDLLHSLLRFAPFVYLYLLGCFCFGHGRLSEV